MGKIYPHGIRILEQKTSIVAPIVGTAGLQIIFGTAPVNLASEPYNVSNVPVLANSFSEAAKRLGYSDDYKNFTLCQSMFASFKLFNIAPVVFVNVLDPKVHRKENPELIVPVNEDGLAVVKLQGILTDTVKIWRVIDANDTATVTLGNGGAELSAAAGGAGKPAAITKVNAREYFKPGEDYELSFDENGELRIILFVDTPEVHVESWSIAPELVSKNDVIGKYESDTGIETGLEVVRQVFPKLKMTPGVILAPGWSQIPEVAAVMAAKCEQINGYFSCECLVDIDSATCRVYSKLLAAKNRAGLKSTHAMALWPCVMVGERIFYYSAVMGALIAYTDAKNDDVPNLSPSNKLLGISGTFLSDGTEITLDQRQGNEINNLGITTAVNVNGWRTWGNSSAAYPDTTDPKDRWFCCRRFFSWWGNSFILTYFQKVDEPANYRLVESVVDSENIRGNAYVAQGKCAAARITFDERENPVTDTLNGKITFHQYLAPYTPAEDILNILEFDVDALHDALGGEA